MNLLADFDRESFGLNLLRFGLAAVFLWFGFSQIFDSLAWVSVVPQWAVDLFHVPPAMIVLANGSFEIVAGTLLAIGVLVRLTSFLLSIHLFFIALTFGITAIGVRDLGLAVATFSLFLMWI